MLSPSSENLSLRQVELSDNTWHSPIFDTVSLSVAKSPTGHQYGEATVHPATCTEDEYSVRICSVCNHKDVVTKEGTKLGHSYIKNVVAPTCT